MEPQLARQFQMEINTGTTAVPVWVHIGGITNIAFPIRGIGGRVVAAINIPHIARIDGMPRPDIEQIKEIMANICMRLSTRIGYDPQRTGADAEH